MNAVYPDRAGILDVLRCLTRDTLATLRNESLLDYAPDDWAEDQHLNEAPLYADSLEVLTLAGHVNRLFSMDETGLEDYLLRRRTLGDWADLVEKVVSGDGLSLGSSGLRFLTSGSTGTPREHAHSWFALGREVNELAKRFARRQRILCLAPRHHIYGFIFGVLLPRALGVPVLTEQDAEAAMLRDLRAGDLIIGFPMRWQYVEGSRQAFPEDVEGVTSTGPCEEALIHRLRAKGLSRMHEIYGSTETGGIGIRTRPEAAFTLFPWWQLGRESSMTLFERGVATASQGIPLPDRLTTEGKRHFRPLGRRDGAVQVGGINVSPELVAQRLCHHPAVAKAVVRPGPAGRLKAFLVPVSNGPAGDNLSEAAMRAWMSENLPAHERPAELRFGDELPRNALGKAADWA
ncbi:4-coumarate--CoA ligase [Natronospira proteinivora]|uniref:4-coumarate--CoA ligase n=1 Tax=Natronospira proteinivora TaxID=1807133 RepID=A0ABT1G929_9GAMM|nr:4-coumarate--CoA ligase [Natronospira proteinivora]MCP1727809.1 4-coumarate--CoA ligase [Natronospira proteinivora]